MNTRSIPRMILASLLVSTLAMTLDIHPATHQSMRDSGNQASTKSWMQIADPHSRSQVLEVLKCDEKSCVLAVSIYGMYRERMMLTEKTFEKLTIPQYGYLVEPGKPQLPALRGLIEIPAGKNVNLATKVVCYSEFEGFRIYPCQKLILESEEDTNVTAFEFNQTFYSTNAYYPDKLVSISSPAQLRDHTVVQLSVFPVQFNPAINKVRVSTRIEITLEYHNAAKTYVKHQNKVSSLAFEEVCRSVVLNYDFSRLRNLEDEPMGYLVIANDIFQSSLSTFVECKAASGLSVTLVKTSDIAADVTDTDIYGYVRNAFHNWTLPPTYLLLVGDVEYVPTHYGLITLEDENERVATDHYYACVHGDDYLPDLFVGRLSVKNVSELNSILDKLIGYEGLFNKNITLIANREHEDFSNSVYDSLSAEGFAVDRLYESGSNATISNIVNATNEGRAIISYYGHGLDTQWHTSSFSNSDVSKLDNEGKYPIVLSFACLTGHYDLDSSDCLGESWMKAQGKGAVGFWGASRSIYVFSFSYTLCKGFYLALLNDNLYEFGSITVQAKLYMYDFWGDSYSTNVHFELFNVLTDPQLATYLIQTQAFHIRANGAVDPPTTYISSLDNTTYTFTNDINGSIKVQKSNITIDGNGYALRGYGNGTGFFISYYTSNVTIKNTIIQGFAKGIFFDSTANISLSANSLEDNYFGVKIDYSTNISISRNTITHNKIGIKLYGSSHSSISGNKLANNEIGIELRASSRNGISENNIAASSQTGISLYQSHCNCILGNTFSENQRHASTYECYANSWNSYYPCCGNYWSNYTGVDYYGGCYQNETGSDGIGDTLHDIDTYNTDNYPLMGAFSSFRTPYDHEITVISNSSISDFDFALIDLNHAALTLNITGMTGTKGFTRICIPKALINGSYVAKFDREVITSPQVRELSCSNGTHEYLYINYTHSKHTITITGTTMIPESSSFVIIPIFMIATLLAVLIYKRKHLSLKT